MSGLPRIGLCTFRFPKSSEAWAVNKFVGLVDAGFDVHVFSLLEGTHWDRFEVFSERPELREHVHHGPGDHDRAGLARSLAVTAASHPGDLARFVLHCWRERRRTTLGFGPSLRARLPFVGREVDVLHLELDTLAGEFADMKEFLGAKLVLSGRSTLQFTGRPDDWSGGYDLLFSMADAYHVESEYTRDNLHSLGLDPAVPIWLIPSSVDATGRFFPDPNRTPRTSEGPLHLLSVSRLVAAKGLDFAIDAVARLRDGGVDVRYTIVGEGSHGVALRQAAAQLGLLDDGVVEFAGGVAHEDMPGYYRRADVLVHPSVDEGLPYAVVEAQACEIPVVAAAAAGTPEAIEDGVTGFLVAARDTPALTHALKRLADDPGLAGRMGRAGRAMVRDRFDEAAWIESYAEMYCVVSRTPR